MFIFIHAYSTHTVSLLDSSPSQINRCLDTASRTRQTFHLSRTSIVRADSLSSHKLSVLLPLTLQVALDIVHDALHHVTLEVTPDFLFKVCKWLGVLVDHSQDAFSEGLTVLIPSIVSETLIHLFEFDQACELFFDDFPYARLDEKLLSFGGSARLSVLGLYQ